MHRQPPPLPVAREPLLHWARGWLPDLRIAHALVDGKRRSFARFTWRGDVVELDADGEDDLAIVLEVANGLREQLRLAPLGRASSRDEDERAILAAAARGNDAEAAALSAALVARNAAGAARVATAPGWVYATRHDDLHEPQRPRTRFARW